MGTTRIESDANKLLIAIGANIEQWILNHARANVEGRSAGTGQAVTIEIDDIRDSFEAFITHGIGDVRRRIVEGNRSTPSESLRAG